MAKWTWLVGMIVVLATLSGGASNAQPEPPGWCLRWNDGCSTCSRPDKDAAIACTPVRSGCVGRAIRCEIAYQDELKRTCEQPARRDTCNVCTGPPGGVQTCTLQAWPPGQTWIVCLRPRARPR